MDYTEKQATEALRLATEATQIDGPAAVKLNNMWSTLLAIRARMLVNTVVNMAGRTVLAGPFKGMKLTPEAIAPYNACILLGSYEHELHPVFEKIIAGNYTHIVNIGCSVGYYAVGLALRIPHIIIDAFDTDAEARRKCAEMAALNGVQDRVRIDGDFRGEYFDRYAAEKTLALVDIEGGEIDLLDPARYPALQNTDVVVELHDLINRQMSSLIAERFAPTHMIDIIRNRPLLPDLSPLIPTGETIDVLDHALLGWEGRGGPTPWGVFIKKPFISMD